MVATGGVMVMKWGDALASIVGERCASPRSAAEGEGRRAYTAWGHRRTWEGSVALFLSSLAVGLTLLLLPGSSLSPNTAPIQAGAALLYAALASLVTVLDESVSPAGTDNLSMPILTAATLYLLI